MTMDRRNALKSVGALFGAMATAGAVAPTRQPKPAQKAAPDDYAEARLSRWEEQTYGKPGSVKRRRMDETLTALLPAYREVAAALNAVLEAGYEVSEDSYWMEDVDGIRYYAEWFASVLASEAFPHVRDAAAAELARRVEAHERGVYHHCPVYWGCRAIQRALKAARTVLDRDYGPGEKPCVVEWDVRYQAWAAEMWEGCFDNESHLYMNEPAKAAYAADLFARIAGDGNAAAAG